MPTNPRKRKLSEDESLPRENESIGWFDMPFEMRELVINEMDVKTKCSFAQCSKKCAEEVEKSKNYLTSIEINRVIRPRICIGLGGSYSTYRLEFWDVSDLSESKTKVVYKTVSWDEKWTKTENGCAEEVRLKYVNEYIQKYSRTIQRIIIDDKLECSKIWKNDWQKLTSLNYLNCWFYDVREKGLMDLSQIKKINKCILPETVFTFEEILQFEGRNYQIKSNNFDEENIEKYLRMLKNGEVHRNLELLVVHSNDCRNGVNRERLVKNVDAFDLYEYDNLFVFRFCFLLNYEKESKCYCYVRYDSCVIRVEIISDDYEEVLKNRKPLKF